MHLAPASFDLRLTTGDTLQYSKGLISSIKINHVLLEPSYHSAFLGDEDPKQHTLQPGYFIDWERHLQKTLFNLTGKAPIGTINQPLCCQTPGNRRLDSWDTSKESTKPQLDLHTIW